MGIFVQTSKHLADWIIGTPQLSICDWICPASTHNNNITNI